MLDPEIEKSPIYPRTLGAFYEVHDLWAAGEREQANVLYRQVYEQAYEALGSPQDALSLLKLAGLEYRKTKDELEYLCD